MNKRMISLMAAALTLLSASGQVEFTGPGGQPAHVVEVTPESNTDLKKIYVVYDTEGVQMSYRSSTGERATWSTYTYRNGGLEMEHLTDVRWNGMSTTLDRIRNNVGYEIRENNRPYYYWVINYADYQLELNTLSEPEFSCEALRFYLDGRAEPIYFYEPGGQRHVLDRQIELSYKTLKWDDDATEWVKTDTIVSYEYMGQTFEIEPPLCRTLFLLTGDRFLKEFSQQMDLDLVQGIETDEYPAEAVDSRYFMEQVDDDEGEGEGDDDDDEEQSTDMSVSAPFSVVFRGYPTDAVDYSVWEIATDPEFLDVTRYYQDVLEYTFMTTGTYYVRYVVANTQSACDPVNSEILKIRVLESEVMRDCPNVLLQDRGGGVRGKWKVDCKSIVDFHCWIFNRWGNLVYEYTDPDGYWDGTSNGRSVDTGVYYFVLTAVGSDGEVHKRRGDITVIRYKNGSSGTGGQTDGMVP